MYLARADSRAAVLQREDGQALIIIAIAMVGLLAFLGLVVDVGWGIYQKRAAQNAADAATLAAIRTMANTAASSCNSATLASSVGDIITWYVQANGGTGASPPQWSYIDNMGATVTQANACTSATGVRVTATIPYATLFLGVIGISGGTTSATGSARVQNVISVSNQDVPFAVCATTALKVLNSTTLQPVNLLTSASPFVLNTAEIGNWFIVHDPNISQSGGGSCADDQSSFKGRTDSGALPNPFAAPGIIPTDTGTQAGPTRNRICAACGMASGCNPDGCKLMLAIAVDDTAGSPCAGSDTGNNTCAIGFATFEINQGPPPAPYDYTSCGDSNCHSGKLLGVTTYKGTGLGADTWTPGSPTTVILKLVE